MRGKFTYVFLILLLLSIFQVDALVTSNSKQLRLLAVQETAGGFAGDIADLHLQIRPGSGRVFLDTFPISKVDTQISTRFAKEIVCNFLDTDCSNYDFFYTIRSDSVIIGGPSAGAAISVLTLATLEDLDLSENVTITGTINSGGLIGPVSGLKPKIDAASQSDIDLVLVPGGKVLFEEDNETVDIINYGEDRGVIVKEAYTLNDAVKYFTGKDYETDQEFVIPDEYTESMKLVSDRICNRTDDLYQQMKDLFEGGFEGDDKELARNLMDTAINLTSRAQSANDLGNYYSRASYCFGANIRYRNLVLLQLNMTGQSIAEYIQNINNHILEYEAKIENKSFDTLTAFETYIIVKERIQTAKDFVNNAQSVFQDDKYSALNNLAYAIERLESAKVWEVFFDYPSKKFDINQKVISESCIQKISEAQERFQYVNLFLPGSLNDAKQDIQRAMVDYKNEDYHLCVAEASDAKASINVILSVMGVSEENLPSIVDRKLESVKKIINREQQKGVFPILGYSYYEYAKSLRDSDMYSALIYAEQALELSTLDIYFDESSQDSQRFFSLNLSAPTLVLTAIFVMGMLFGALILSTLVPTSMKKKRVLRRKRIRKRL